MVFGGDTFYHQLITKYVATFGSLFNNMIIQRTGPDGSLTGDFKVPLQYASKEKMMVRLKADPDLDRPYSVLLPVLSFELSPGGCFHYNPTRKLQSLGRKVLKVDDNKNKFKYQYMPMPYDITFNLYVYVKNLEDGNKIVEQIMPAFTPDYTLSVELIPEMNEIRDIPITMAGPPTYEDQYDGDFKVRRTLIWTFQFTMQGWFFGPVRQKPMIKFITLNQRLSNDPIDPEAKVFPPISNNNPIVEVITQYPGLTANGEPTTDPALAIDWRLVAVDDNWNIVQTANTVLNE